MIFNEGFDCKIDQTSEHGSTPAFSRQFLKGTVPQNIFSLKSGYYGCMDFSNNSGKNYFLNKMKINFKIIFGCFGL